MKTKRTGSKARRPSGVTPAPRTKSSRPAPPPGATSRIVGLEACEQFLTHLAPDTGLAFALVSHLDPDRKGIMPELLLNARQVYRQDERRPLILLAMEPVSAPLA